jgi:2-polyprenyl-3-methyl-5-hydroxy-6-metoxy-1,4-benzoquinol methylase
VSLPEASFNMILATDVFEHLTDPVGVVESLWGGLKPVALLFARIHAEADSSLLDQIVDAFGPTFPGLRNWV